VSEPADELAKHWPAFGGVVVATALKLKEGWRVMLTFGLAGAVFVFSLRGVTTWLSSVMHVPFDLAGFLMGALGIATVQKLAETVQMLDIARPINGAIERWTGAKSPEQQK
jgi:hypothetical protein